MHRIQATICLSEFRDNMSRIRSHIGPKVKLLIVIKANAYGFGDVAISQAAVEAGADYLGLATLNEAIQLRQSGIDIPLLLFSEVFESHIPDLFTYQITPSVYSPSFLEQLSAYGKKIKQSLPIHIKVDTGMSRIGCDYDQALSFIQQALRMDYVTVEGVYTHFSHADRIHSDTHLSQWAQFKTLLSDLKDQSLSIPLCHTANSYATFLHPETHLDMVRIGLKSYENILTLTSCVSRIKQIKKNQGVSYGSDFISAQDTTIATIYAGYGDGIPRQLSNKGFVLIKGQRYPIVGRICMDWLMVDIGRNLDTIVVGDRVVLIGTSESEHISIEDISQLTGLNPREISCQLSSRVNRVYI